MNVNEKLDWLEENKLYFPMTYDLESLDLNKLDIHKRYKTRHLKLFKTLEMKNNLEDFKKLYEELKKSKKYYKQLMAKFILNFIEYVEKYLVEYYTPIETKHFVMRVNFAYIWMALKYNNHLIYINLYGNNLYYSYLKWKQLLMYPEILNDYFEELYDEIVKLKAKNVLMIEGYKKYKERQKEIMDSFDAYIGLKK